MKKLLCWLWHTNDLMKQLNKKYTLGMARGLAIILLSVVGITALFGGATLILDPSGQSMKLQIEALSGTMFTNYRAPGIILFLAIGVLSCSVAVLTTANHRNYPILIFYQGIILSGWIMTQIYLLPQTHFLQVVYGLLGIMFMLLGNYLSDKRNHLKTFY